MEGEDGEKGGEDEREGAFAETDSGKVRKWVGNVEREKK